ncbi:uncharacterized protein CDAR_541941 [Caerostris darwini]|uniref:Uncharacterized protein n=1 Tax=Caerostris darwini TaxID=1538125 RepID=A0AAV4UUL3_9ARAC|nr:uncharacterized protein CDAR_541941 [Caerostris darwini]
MPSKQDVCVDENSLPDNFLSKDMEELVAAIKHNLHLKSKPSYNVYSKHRRMAPYAAPVRATCRKLNSPETAIDHYSSTCKYCIIRSKSTKKNSPQDPYEILNFLKKGILISEAVKRVQMDFESNRCKRTDFYELDDVEVNVESV